jgi:hypothetical protein
VRYQTNKRFNAKDASKLVAANVAVSTVRNARSRWNVLPQSERQLQWWSSRETQRCRREEEDDEWCSVCQSRAAYSCNKAGSRGRTGVSYDGRMRAAQQQQQQQQKRERRQQDKDCNKNGVRRVVATYTNSRLELLSGAVLSKPELLYHP